MRYFFLFIVTTFFSVNLLNADNPHSGSEPAVIFASGNTKFILPELIRNFSMHHPEARLVVQYGATGDLTNAILDGVRYDIFLAADMEFPAKVYRAKKAVAMPKLYAEGSLILFVPEDKKLRQKGLSILKEPKITKITIANKKTAPYGKASIEVLNKVKMFETLSNKIEYSTDISTVINNVIWYDNAGFLSKSAVNSLPVGYRSEGIHWIEIDHALYSPILQGYVVSEAGMKNSSAEAFIDFLTSQEAKMIFQYYGYR